MALVDDVLNIFHGQPQALTKPEVSVAAKAVADPAELELTNSCVQLVERDEGDRLNAYPDPGTGGDPWTIGYGHTGPEVHEGLMITQSQAEMYLEDDLSKFSIGVRKFVGTATCNDNQFSAMVSLAYNVGLGNFERSSVLRFHNAGQYPRAADAFLLWDKAAGRVLPGLVRRRHQERELYLGLEIDP